MASSTLQAFCNRRARFIHVSCQIIPKGTVIGKDKVTGVETRAERNLVGPGTLYRNDVTNTRRKIRREERRHARASRR